MVDHRPAAILAGVSTLLILLMVASTSAAGYQDNPTVTVYEVDLEEDGDATWTIELRYQLSSDEVEDFQEFRQQYEAGEVDIFEGVEEELRQLVAEAAENTGREMEATDFGTDVRVESTLTGEAGVTALNFTWTSFADGDRVGDVFEDGGLVLSGDQRLVVNYPDSLEVDAVSPEPTSRDEGTLVWEGEKFFEDGTPSLTLSEPAGAADENGLDVSAASLAVIAIAVLLSGFGGGLLVSRSLGSRDGERRNGEPTSEIDEVESMEDEVDEELLTDRDRIVKMLEDSGGRMKQADIVEETGWSKSKVSMLLSEMEEEDRVSKLRLGRENVIDLEDGGSSDS